MASLLGQVRRRKVDGDALGGKRQSGSMKCCAHPFAAFSNSLVGEANDIDDRLAGLDHHLHIDRYGLDALKRHRLDPRHHEPSPRLQRSATHGLPAIQCNLYGLTHLSRTKVEQNSAALFDSIPEQGRDIGSGEAFDLANAGW